MKINRILLSLAFLPLLCRLTYALPDLRIDDITFSNSNPEPAEVITISATIRNIGTTYYVLVSKDTPFESHDYLVSASSTGAHLYNARWYAQYFI